MESRVKFLGHPIHPMLIVVPLGLLSAAVIFDIVYLFVDDEVFNSIAFWNMSLGIVGGLLAAIFGFIDWLNIPKETRAKRIGLLHGGGNVAVVMLFAISWFLRLNETYEPSAAAYVFSFVGLGLATVTAWLGGELVDRLGVGVDEGANVNASSSLTGEPARHVGGGATPGATPAQRPRE